MAKRVRGSRSTHRPGGQGPSRTSKTSDGSSSAADDASQATTDDIDAAIESSAALDVDYAEIVTEEPAAAASTSKPRRSRRRAKGKSDDLAARVAAEDVWVREDLRRIGIVSVILVAALAVAWVVFVLMDVLSLY